jgi:hypothetical protein
MWAPARVRATLNKSLAAGASPLWAVCRVANPRHSFGYGCGLRLAAHPKARLAASRGHIQRRLSLLALVAATGTHAATPLLPPLPPDPPTGFFVRYRVDGRPVSQTLYGFRHHPYAILQRADDSPGDAQQRTLRLAIESSQRDTVHEGIALHVQDRFRLDAPVAQTFLLTGGAFCRPASEQPKSLDARAEYAVARPGTPPTSGGRVRWGFPLSEGTLDDDRASREPLGYVTGARGLTGTFEGELVVTRIDRTQQVLEGRFRFDAARHITTRRKPTGEWEARCSEAGDFDVGRVSVTEGEFRLRYCLDPVQPGNHRSCPDGLSPDAPR